MPDWAQQKDGTAQSQELCHGIQQSEAVLRLLSARRPTPGQRPSRSEFAVLARR